MGVMMRLLLILIFSLNLLSEHLFCQNTSTDSLSPSLGLKFRPALMLPEFIPQFELNYKKDLPGTGDQYRWLTPFNRQSPFQMDTRTSSYYVPRDVRDELNLIMNRPRETAFVPVLGVAYLAYQLAQKYLFIKSKMTITSQDLLTAADKLGIIISLWNKSPQSMFEIYDSLPGVIPTPELLEEQLERLQDSKLIRSRKADKQTLYFPAISREVFKDKIEQAIQDSTLGPTEIDILKKLSSNLN